MLRQAEIFVLIAWIILQGHASEEGHMNIYNNERADKEAKEQGRRKRVIREKLSARDTEIVTQAISISLSPSRQYMPDANG